MAGTNSPAKPSQFSLLSLLLLTALGATVFFAFNQHVKARRLSEEVQMLRALLQLERRYQTSRETFGGRHPQAIQLASEIEELEKEIAASSEQ